MQTQGWDAHSDLCIATGDQRPVTKDYQQKSHCLVPSGWRFFDTSCWLLNMLQNWLLFRQQVCINGRIFVTSDFSEVNMRKIYHYMITNLQFLVTTLLQGCLPVPNTASSSVVGFHRRIKEDKNQQNQRAQFIKIKFPTLSIHLPGFPEFVTHE